MADTSKPTTGRRTSRLVVGSTAKKPSNLDGEGVIAMLNHPINVMIVFMPLGVASHYFLKWGDVADFGLNFLAMVPLAKILGDATEELAAGLRNDMLAGLLNATFGNAVEVVIMMQTLRKGYYGVVKASLLGSMLSNLLLVLGTSFLCGGLLSFQKKSVVLPMGPKMRMTVAGSGRKTVRPGYRNPLTGGYREMGPQASMDEGYYSTRSDVSSRPELMGPAPSLMGPTPSLMGPTSSQMGPTSSQMGPTSSQMGRSISKTPRYFSSESGASELQQQLPPQYELGMSAEKVQEFATTSALVNTSMLLLSCLSFSIVTIFHAQMRGQGSTDEHWRTRVLLPISRFCSVICSLSYAAYVYFQLVTHKDAMADDAEDDDGDEEAPKLTIPTALFVMVSVTLLIGFCSELLVMSFEGVVDKLGINSNFIGIILLPIVGNACEHASAVRFAVMEKCGLAIGIAVGSSTQIALFAVPFSVIFAWIIDRPLDLNFGLLNTTVLTISVVIMLSIVVDGKANWLQGYLLIAAYFVIAVLYWHLPQEANDM